VTVGKRSKREDELMFPSRSSGQSEWRGVMIVVRGQWCDCRTGGCGRRVLEMEPKKSYDQDGLQRGQSTLSRFGALIKLILRPALSNVRRSAPSGGFKHGNCPPSFVVVQGPKS